MLNYQASFEARPFKIDAFKESIINFTWRTYLFEQLLYALFFSLIKKLNFKSSTF